MIWCAHKWQKTSYTHQHRASLGLFTFGWWRHNWLGNCDAHTCKVISDSLNINFIHGDIHDRPCKNLVMAKDISWGRRPDNFGFKCLRQGYQWICHQTSSKCIMPAHRNMINMMPISTSVIAFVQVQELLFRHFQIFFEWKFLCLGSNFTKICF